MKKLITAALLLGVINLSAQEADSLKYRISLRDKANTPYSLEQPEAYLSQKAIERRQRQGLAIDSTDLPVNEIYVETIRQKGVNIVTKGKWDNFVTVSTNDTSLIDSITKLPFVIGTERVWKAPRKKPQAPKRDSLINNTAYSDTLYGSAFRQIELSNGIKLHEAGYRGYGMTVAVIDAGYHNLDQITAMNNINILGTKDFVNPQSDIFAEETHGLGVLSCMAMNAPNAMIGTAPEASYWLLRSEDDNTEHLVEQDYWSAAIEFADSVGVDVVNTSLGYYSFDDRSKNYKLKDLDGQFALISRQASKVADKGMVLVCSAGNSGSGTWKKITPPGDAENVLTVGAIDRKGILAPFSSIGNTADEIGRAHV